MIDAQQEITPPRKNKIKNKKLGKDAVVANVLNNYVPCNHEGTLCSASNPDCLCRQSEIHCEKFCLCSSDCEY